MIMVGHKDLEDALNSLSPKQTKDLIENMSQRREGDPNDAFAFTQAMRSLNKSNDNAVNNQDKTAN
jgi:phosphate uptake regulator